MNADFRPTLTLDVVRAVLWHFGDTNLGVEPGGFMSTLILAIARADLSNRAKLALAFPEHVAAVTAVKDEPWGLDWLRGIAKAELDHQEQGLDLIPDTSGGWCPPAAATPDAAREVAAGEPQIPAVTPEQFRHEFEWRR